MSQEILKQPVLISEEAEESKVNSSSWQSYLPVALALFGSVVMLVTRTNIGGDHFISDGALMMLALASYLTASIFYLTNFYAPFKMAQTLGMWGAGLGVFFNLSSWLVRWVSDYERELSIFIKQGRDMADMPWVFRYVPFANLYDLSLAFAFGAGLTGRPIAAFRDAHASTPPPSWPGQAR